MSRIGKSFFLLAILCLPSILISTSNPCFSYVGAIDLARLIGISDHIIIGKVNKIIEMEDNKYADIDVIKILRAKSEVKRLLYSLPGRGFKCDITNAVEGETALFLLKNPGSSAKKLLKERVPVVLDAYFGRGRMPVREVDDKEFVTIWTADVFLPRDLRSMAISGPDPQISSESVPLDEMLKYVKEVINGKRGAREGY